MINDPTFVRLWPGHATACCTLKCNKRCTTAPLNHWTVTNKSCLGHQNGFQLFSTANWLSFDDITKWQWSEGTLIPCGTVFFFFTFFKIVYSFFLFFISVLSSRKLLSHNFCCLGIDSFSFYSVFYDLFSLSAWTILYSGIQKQIDYCGIVLSDMETVP